MKRETISKVLLCAAFLALALSATTTHAQFMGHNAKGDFGLMSASQPPPGWYLAAMYYRYDGDSLIDKNGEEIAIDPEQRGEIDVNAYALGIWGVTKAKILGGNYGFMVFPAITNNKLEIPILQTEEKLSTGLTDLYIQPINLGWHTKYADCIAGIGVFAPTGSYDPEESSNLGLGMWSFELFGGATLFLDEAKTWTLATTAFYEWHTKKEDTDIKVGDILTLEGGFGKSFKEGAINVGIAYYAQWKMTDDDVGSGVELPDGFTLGRNRVYGFGPDITIPIATKKKLIAFLNARYFWETGARTTLQGNTFVVTATFPLPSISLQ